MYEPQSPFDEPPAEQTVHRGGGRLPERKWSFVALAVVLFALVWIREIIPRALPPAVTIAVAVLVVGVWGAVHLSLFGRVPRWIEVEPHAAGRSGRELAEPRPPQRWTRPMLIGLIVGSWLPYFVPLGPIGVTLLLLIIAAVGGAVLLLFRLVQRLLTR